MQDLFLYNRGEEDDAQTMGMGDEDELGLDDEVVIPGETEDEEEDFSSFGSDDE